MHASTTPEQPSAEEWRRHCQDRPAQFLPIRGGPSARVRIERWEERLIDELRSTELSLHERAVALRTIVALRGCTVRDAAHFLAADPRVVVASMSLIELPAEPATKAPPASTRSKVA